MDYDLGIDTLNDLLEFESIDPDGVEEVCSSGVFQQIQSDNPGFTSALIKDGIIKKRKIDSDKWTESNVKFLLSIVEEMAPKLRCAIKSSNRDKIWVEIHKSFQDAGYTMTHSQVVNKCTSLFKEYEKVRQEEIMTGEMKECAYKGELERIRVQWPKGFSYDDITDEYNMDEELTTNFTNSKKLASIMDDDEDKVEYCNWPEEKVKLLLSSVEEMLPKIGESPDLPRKSKMWAQITQRFREKGYSITGVQIQNKYTSLIRQYRRMKSRAKQDGRRLSCPYKTEIERILKIPPDTNSTDYTTRMRYIKEMNNTVENASDAMTDDSEFPDASSSFQFSRNNNNFPPANVVEEIRKIRQLKEQYYKQKKEYLNRKKLHLERKEEHMQRKEALLRAVLSKLENS